MDNYGNGMVEVLKNDQSPNVNFGDSSCKRGEQNKDRQLWFKVNAKRIEWINLLVSVHTTIGQ